MGWSFLDRLRLSRARHAGGEVPVVLYTRDGCTLCEELVAWMREADLPVAWTLERVNVDSDPVLAEDLGQKIPVVYVGGRLSFAGRVRRETVAPRFLELSRRFLRDGPGEGYAIGPPVPEGAE